MLCPFPLSPPPLHTSVVCLLRTHFGFSLAFHKRMKKMLKDMLSDFQKTPWVLCFKINHSQLGLQHKALECLTDGVAEGSSDSGRGLSRAQPQSAACSPESSLCLNPSSTGYSSHFLINRVSSFLKTYPLITRGLTCFCVFIVPRRTSDCDLAQGWVGEEAGCPDTEAATGDTCPWKVG